MLSLRGLLLCALATSVACSAAFGGDRYFYHRHGQAYFCQQPPAYQEGCYVVCDDSSVIRIGEYPTITTAAAEKVCGTDRTSQPVVALVAQTVEPNDAIPPAPPEAPTAAPEAPATGDAPMLPPEHNPNCCDGETPTPPGNCWPTLVKKCLCYGEPKKIADAPCTKPGPLKVYEGPGKPYYKYIYRVDATIPVPEINYAKDETYQFEQQTIAYACKDSLSGIADCTFEKPCEEPCTIRTCKVVCKTAVCRAECVLNPRKGSLLLGVREVNGKYLVDVIIGKQPPGADFAAYPSCTVILWNYPLGEVHTPLGIPNAITPDSLQSLGTDLFAHL